MMMIKEYLKESQALQDVLLADDSLKGKFDLAVEKVLAAFASGNKVLVAGNGGSAADAQHFAGEFMGKYKLVRKPYPAIALTTDTSILTAWSNDNSFDGVFERQIEGLGKKGDIFFGITTSGNSKNVLQAFGVAKRSGIFTVALLGGDGGKAKGMADLEFIIPSKNIARIQEMHTLVLHSIAEETEKRMA